MLRRILALLAARYRSQGKGRSPMAALWSQALVGAVAALVLRKEVSLYAFALAALSTCTIALALPLLGELAPSLGDDENAEWLRAQPVRPWELRVARTLHLTWLLAGMGLASSLPWALWASGWTAQSRAALVLTGIGLAWAVGFFAIGLRGLSSWLGGWLCVLAQTLLWTIALLGALLGPRTALQCSDPELAAGLGVPVSWPPFSLAERILAAPPEGWTWIAGFAALACSALVVLPAPQAERRSSRAGWLALLLRPLRALAWRAWVRPRERAGFAWVYDALPLEPEFTLRAYPLVAAPLGLVLLGVRSEAGIERDTWMALLVFLPGLYLPLLAAHVPLSRSAEARWLVETGPTQRIDLDRGALKAVALRILVPLYALTFAASAALCGLEFALKLTPLALVAAWIVLRASWSTFAADLPLSVAPRDLRMNMDWLGPLGGVGLALAILAAACVRWVPSAWVGLGSAVALFLLVEGLARPRRT
jgi:hypothetical protein